MISCDRPLRLLLTWSVACASVVCSAVPSTASFKYLKPGAEVPDFTVRTLGGQELTLAGLKENTAALLVFWATWSPKAEPALREAQALHESYVGSGLRVVAVNLDRAVLGLQEQALIEKTVSDLGLTVTIAHDPGFAVSATAIGVVANPSFALIDARGVLAWDGAGWSRSVQDMLREQVKALLGLTGAAPAAVAPARVLGHTSLLNYNLGRSFLRQGNRDKAMSLLAAAAAADPAAVPPRTLLGHLLLQRDRAGDQEQAEALFRAAAALDPRDVSALAGLGDVLLRSDRVEEAAAAFEKAAALDAAFTPAIIGQALTKARLGRPVEALALCAAALELNPRDARTYEGRGACLELAGDVRAAAADYRRAVEILTGNK